MSIVGRPCVIDFASADLDDPPPFPPEAWGQWQEEIQDKFGSRWKEVATMYDELKRKCRLYYLDLSPRNVFFSDKD